MEVLAGCVALVRMAAGAHRGWQWRDREGVAVGQRGRWGLDGEGSDGEGGSSAT